MKITIGKIFFIITIAITFSFSSSNNYSNVFICNSKTAKKYHLSKDCRGLSNCKAETIRITLSKAKELKRTLCGWED